MISQLPKILIFVSCICASVAASATPVEWTVAAGGNGHYYEVVLAPGGISWTSANAAAAANGGYLATLRTASENEFVFSLVNEARYWSQTSDGSGSGPWLGGIQVPGSAEPAGGWEWLHGEGSFSYANWAAGEPNDNGGSLSEDKLLFWANPGTSNGRSPFWNDISTARSTQSFVVEYDTLPVPEPSVDALMVLGLLFVARRYFVKGPLLSDSRAK